TRNDCPEDDRHAVWVLEVSLASGGSKMAVVTSKRETALLSRKPGAVHKYLVRVDRLSAARRPGGADCPCGRLSHDPLHRGGAAIRRELELCRQVAKGDAPIVPLCSQEMIRVVCPLSARAHVIACRVQKAARL